jgi:hypothetical protein
LTEESTPGEISIGQLGHHVGLHVSVNLESMFVGGTVVGRHDQGGDQALPGYQRRDAERGSGGDRPHIVRDIHLDSRGPVITIHVADALKARP